MKALVFAIICSLCVVTLVGVNSLLLDYHIGVLIDTVESTPPRLEEKEAFSRLYQDFTKRQKYISLTVSHEDMTDIESELAEILGAIDAEDEGALMIAKSRLYATLTHLRRLTGVNIDSIL